MPDLDPRRLSQLLAPRAAGAQVLGHLVLRVVLGEACAPPPRPSRPSRAPRGPRRRSRSPRSRTGSAPPPCRPPSRRPRACCRRTGPRAASCASCQAQAARIQTASSSCTSFSCQWPTMTVRSRRIRVPMKPNSRSPWADWLRFMKSMSMADQGMSRLYWVCRWAKGFVSAESPAIHILAGEKVCIQATRPMQFFAEFASRQTSRIASGVVTTGLNTSVTGIAADAERPRAISRACSATLSRVSFPYRCWLPVTNQASRC